MYHPDLYYEQHMRRLDELHARAQRNRLLAALAPARPARAWAMLAPLGALSQAFRGWLNPPAQPSEQPACTCGC